MLEFETFYLLSSIPMALRLFNCRSYLTEGSSEELQGMYHPYQDSAERDVIFYLPLYQVSVKGNLIFYPLNQGSGEARLVRYQVTLPKRNFLS